MAVMDEYKEERESIKQAPLKEKIEYFFDYYKWQTIGGLLIFILVGSVVYDVLTNKEVVMSATLINTFSYENNSYDEFIAEVSERMGIDTNTQEIYIDSEYYLDFVEEGYDHVDSLSVLYTLAAGNSVDIMASDEYTIARLAYKDLLMPLENYLSDELLEKYADQMIYIDGAVQEILFEIGLDLDYEGEYPEYLYGDSEGMEDPIAIGLIMEYDTALGECGMFVGDYGVIGVVSTCLNLEYALEFLESALEEGE